MALSWDTTKCANPIPVDDNETAARECLIWGSIGVDMGEITEKNVDEWMFRLRLLERVGMSIATQPIPVEVVKRWVGLKTNVFTETRKKWMKKVMEILERRVKESLYDENLKKTA